MRYHPVNPYNFVSDMACAGCSTPVNTGVWMSDASAAGNGGNYVMTSGQEADKLRQSYAVGTIDASNFSQLYGESVPVLTRQSTNVSGTFVGEPVRIALTSKPGVVAPIADSAMAVFSTPPSKGEEYQIVHIGQVGSELRWITVKGAIADDGGASIRVPVSETGNLCGSVRSKAIGATPYPGSATWASNSCLWRDTRLSRLPRGAGARPALPDCPRPAPRAKSRPCPLPSRTAWSSRWRKSPRSSATSRGTATVCEKRARRPRGSARTS